jgi:hypothetical protein
MTIFVLFEAYRCENPWCSPEHVREVFSDPLRAKAELRRLKAQYKEALALSSQAEALFKSRIDAVLEAHGFQDSVSCEQLELERVLLSRCEQEVGLSPALADLVAVGPWPTRVVEYPIS